MSLCNVGRRDYKKDAAGRSDCKSEKSAKSTATRKSGKGAMPKQHKVKGLALEVQEQIGRVDQELDDNEKQLEKCGAFYDILHEKRMCEEG